MVFLDSVEAAAEWLDAREGQILVTTGSKELKAYTKIRNWQERIFARVLSTEESIRHCAALGFEGRNLIAMQGPFTEALNEAMLRAYDIQYLVTKDTGRSGGFAEKIEACRACGCTPVIIGRPCTETGISVTACKQHLIEHLDLRPSVEITLIGIGPGGTGRSAGTAATGQSYADWHWAGKRGCYDRRRYEGTAGSGFCHRFR